MKTFCLTTHSHTNVNNGQNLWSLTPNCLIRPFCRSNSCSKASLNSSSLNFLRNRSSIIEFILGSWFGKDRNFVVQIKVSQVWDSIKGKSQVCTCCWVRHPWATWNGFNLIIKLDTLTPAALLDFFVNCLHRVLFSFQLVRVDRSRHCGKACLVKGPGFHTEYGLMEIRSEFIFNIWIS